MTSSPLCRYPSALSVSGVHRLMRHACASDAFETARQAYHESVAARVWDHPSNPGLGVSRDQPTPDITLLAEGRRQWATVAVRSGNFHIVGWIRSLILEDGVDCEMTRYDKAVACACLSRLRSPSGTVQDVLSACGEGWRSWCAEPASCEWEVSEMQWEGSRLEARTLRQFRGGRDNLQAITCNDVALPVFKFFTPRHVTASTQDAHILTHIVRLACCCYEQATPCEEAGARYGEVAMSLLAMGFDTDERACLLLDKNQFYTCALRSLMHEIVRVLGGRKLIVCELSNYDGYIARARANLVLVRCVVRACVWARRARRRAYVA